MIQSNTIREIPGYRIQLEEVACHQIGLKWGSYLSPEERVLSFHPAQASIVSHFLLTDSIGGAKRETLRERQFVVHRETIEAYELCLAPTAVDTPRSFFELSVSNDFFSNILTEESAFMMRFQHSPAIAAPCFDFIAQMTSAMYAIIRDMRNAPYSGYLKGVYLETKAMELFLMEIDQLDRTVPAKRGKTAKLKPVDKEGLYGIKNYIDTHYHLPCPIHRLSRQAGMNQTKLKSGFKELFDATIFGYLTSVRMEEARRLLVEQKLPVNEVADRVGYQHPHHFAAAFKKKFGKSPGRYFI